MHDFSKAVFRFNYNCTFDVLCRHRPAQGHISTLFCKMIPFTRRELTNAWRSSWEASHCDLRRNPQRLLLFYAVECGLKAVYLRRSNEDYIDEQLASRHLHDLNSLMTELCMGKEYFLPKFLALSSITTRNGKDRARNTEIGSLNQIWRYGGMLEENMNTMIETVLEKICAWIAKEIG